MRLSFILTKHSDILPLSATIQKNYLCSNARNYTDHTSSICAILYFRSYQNLLMNHQNKCEERKKQKKLIKQKIKEFHKIWKKSKENQKNKRCLKKELSSKMKITRFGFKRILGKKFYMALRSSFVTWIQRCLCNMPRKPLQQIVGVSNWNYLMILQASV